MSEGTRKMAEMAAALPAGSAERTAMVKRIENRLDWELSVQLGLIPYDGPRDELGYPK